MGDLLGFDDLMNAGSNHFRKKVDLSSNEVVEMSYGSEVPVARDVETGEVITVPFDGETRILLCASSGQGKTLMGKTYLSRIVDKGGKVFCGSDVKNDFQSFDYKTGVSKELVDVTQGVLRNEEPKIDDARDFGNDFAKTLSVPYFMKPSYDSNPRNVAELFTIGFSDISRSDFKQLIGFDSWRSDAQKRILEDILYDINSMSELTWEYLFSMLDKEGKSGEKVKKRLSPLKKSNLIGSKGENINGVLSFDGVNLVSLGLKNMRDFDDSKVEFYSSLMHREFFDICKDDDIPTPRVLYDDEVHELAPSDRSTAVKDELALAFSRKGRQAKLATVLSSQEPHKIPSADDRSPHDFVSPTTHAFVGRGLSWEGYRTVFQVFRFYDSNRTNELKQLTNKLEKHQFLYMDQSMTSRDDVRIVESLAPLVAHTG